MEGIQLNIIKNIHGKPTPNIILNVKKTKPSKKNESIAIKTRKKTGMAIIPSHFYYSVGCISKNNKAREKIMGIQIGQVRLALLLDNILSKSDPTNYTRKL